MSEFRKTFVTIDDSNAYPAYVKQGEFWNGWREPYFTVETAFVILRDFNLKYRILPDESIITTDNNDLPDTDDLEKIDAWIEESPFDANIWAKLTIVVDGESIPTYAVGAGFWIWDEAQDIHDQGQPTMATDNKIKLTRKIEAETGIADYHFYLSTDEYFLFNSALLALKNHGSVSSTINGKEVTEYHRSQGYRTYMIWGSLPDSADTTRFLHEVLNRRNETIYDRYGRIVGIVGKDI